MHAYILRYMHTCKYIQTNMYVNIYAYTYLLSWVMDTFCFLKAS